ncbi:MAG: hypothetical protein WCI79_00080 [Candidatus Saccharibacteria bacterium]
MDDLVEKTLRIVYASDRVMPAHYTNTNDRKQTFAIDFDDMSEVDEYEMASEAFYSVPNMPELTQEQLFQLIHIGEDVMIGAFIIAVFGGEGHAEELKDIILKDSKVIMGDSAIEYIDHCRDFGLARAKNKAE